jgi:hypothetical protein
MGGGGKQSADEGMKIINYGGVAFPFSRAGVKPSPSRFTATQVINTCDLTELVTIGRPTDEEVRRQWTRRFVADMHWLPLIEALSGCSPALAPAAHAAFMTGLGATGMPRAAHQPWGTHERFAWSLNVRDRVKLLCPSPAARASLAAPITALQDGNADVVFVGNGCIAAGENALPDCLLKAPWLLYKAVTVVKGRLPDDEHRAMLLHGIGSDPSAEEYCGFVTNGSLR